MPNRDRDTDPLRDRVGTPRYFGRCLTRLRISEAGDEIDQFAEKLGYPSVSEYIQQESGKIPVPSRDLLIDRLSRAKLLPEESCDLIMAAGYLPDGNFGETTDGVVSLAGLPMSVFMGGMRELTHPRVGLKDYASIAFAVLKDAVLRRRA